MKLHFTLENHFASPFDEIFAIGDVHGFADQLHEALVKIANIQTSVNRRRKLVFLGDLIDRGPDSLRCIDLARDARRLAGVDEVIYLMGNHEQMLVNGLRSVPLQASEFDADGLSEDDQQALTLWLCNGGQTILDDYEINELPGLIGAERRAWLKELKLFFISGDIMFIHAGLPPHVPLPDILTAPLETSFFDLVEGDHPLWTREPFLEYAPGEKGHHGFFVAHGHTIRDPFKAEDQIHHRRINLDGGSYRTKTIRFAHFRQNLVDRYEIKAS